MMDPYEGFAERYDLSFGPFGEREPQVIEFFRRLFVVDYFGDRARYDVLDIFHGDEMSDLIVWSAEIHVLLRVDQERLLKAAGFQTVDFFGAFDLTPYDTETSHSLITVAYK